MPGIVLTKVSPETQDRLGYFASGLGWGPEQVQIVIGGHAHAAMMFRPNTPAKNQTDPWDHAAWQERWGALSLLATDEIMRHQSRVSEAKLAQRLPMILARAAAKQAAANGVPSDIRSPMTADQVNLISQHTRHAGFFLTREDVLRHPDFNGGMSPKVHREVFVATDAAIVLPYDPARDRVLLVEQFRMGPFGRGDPKPWMLEPVAGRVDAGETPEETAHRECREEAGLNLRRLEKIASYYCSPGCSTEYFHCYLGLCDLPEIGKGQGGLASEHEDIRTHVLDFDTAMGLYASGEADNGPLILSLIWLAQQRERLRANA